MRRYLGSVLMLFTACADAADTPRTDGAADVAEWRLAAEPLLEIGVVDGDPAYQLHQVSGATLLDDGRIALVNSGSSQLRIYDAQGTLTAQHGRKGSGPGEFQVPGRVYVIGDTIAVFDQRLRRMSLHGLDGGYIANREVSWNRETVPFPMDEWLHGRSWIDGPPLGAGRAQVRAAIDRLPAPDTAAPVRHVRATPQGQIWVREADDDARARWLIHDLEGNAVARLVLPPRFLLLESGTDYVLGVARDEMDVERLQLFRLETGDAPLAARALTPSPDDMVMAPRDTVATERYHEMMATLRMMSAHQEIFYSAPANEYNYATSVAQLEGLEVPAGVQLEIIRADAIGWFGVAVDRASGRMCGVGFGYLAPAGWQQGVVTCQ